VNPVFNLNDAREILPGISENVLRSIYEMLNEKAKAWWHYADLRRAGKTEEAQRHEARSLRGDFRTLAQALASKGAHLRIGRGGFTFLYADGCTVSGYDEGKEYQKACRLLGIPVVDTRTVPNERLQSMFKLPMVAVGREPEAEPYHGFSYAPLSYYIEKVAQLGATIS